MINDVFPSQKHIDPETFHRICPRNNEREHATHIGAGVYSILYY